MGQPQLALELGNRPRPLGDECSLVVLVAPPLAGCLE